MIRLSKLFFILTLFGLGSVASAFSIAPNMGCGVYHVSGVVKFNSQGQALIRIQDRTSSPYELLLLYPDPAELLRYRDMPVAAEVRVRQPIVGNNQPFIAFIKWLDHLLPADNAVQQVRKEKCPQ